jgi:4-amino-4-deoxy-L-arabinose transferase-like glycosyltransferase
VKGGFRLVALILIGFAVAGMFFGGVLRLCFLGAVDRSSWSGQHAASVALVFLIVSIPIMFVTMSRWLKVMAGFLGLAVINGLISLGTGHVLANPTMPIPRLYALSLTLFFAAAAVLTGKIKNRKLGVVERILVIVFLFSLGILISYQAQRELTRSAPFNSAYFILMGIGLGCLLVAWGYDRLQRRRGHNLPAEC